MLRLTVILFAFISLAVSTGLAAEAGKIAYVDLQKALNLSEAGKAAKEKIKIKVESYDGEVSQRQEELKKMKEDLEKQAMLLSEEARNAKERDYQQKVKDYQRFTKDIQEELQQTDADYTRKILEDILKLVQNIGKQEGYVMILEKTESSLVYADESIDLTDKVIQAFDKQGK
ncbi:MAG: OmpH family outer membrane protein [Deltaproteobacteria bacterium]|jgi:outer membrane protein|nr:OmpH family outer membrane protein [Deltaproteobacteria bacterium]